MAVEHTVRLGGIILNDSQRMTNFDVIGKEIQSTSLETYPVLHADGDPLVSIAMRLGSRISIVKNQRNWAVSSFPATAVAPRESARYLGLRPFASSKEVLVCTAATHRTSGLADLEQSCERAGIQLRVFGLRQGSRWRGFKFNKLKTLCWELQKPNPVYEYVFYTDAFDSVIVSNLACIMRKFLALDTPLLFSAEANCYPACLGQREDDYPISPTKYRFLNAGGFVGRADYLLKVMTEWHALNHDAYDDQQWWPKVYLSGKTQIKLDHGCDIFQCLHKCEDDVELSPSGIRNRITGPCIVHANGFAHLDPAADHVLGRTIWEAWLRRLVYLPVDFVETMIVGRGYAGIFWQRLACSITPRKWRDSLPDAWDRTRQR
jgi:hypothetical protein